MKCIWRSLVSAIFLLIDCFKANCKFNDCHFIRESNMKIFLGLVVAIVLCLTGPLSAQTAYETDTTNFYVENSTNESLKFVNMLLCYMKAMAPDKMVNKGTYVASIYNSDCEDADTSASDQKNAKPKSAQSQSSGGSSSSSSNSSGAQSGKTAESNTISATRVDNNSPMNIKVWVTQPGVDCGEGGGVTANSAGAMTDGGMCMPEPPMTIYVEGTQSAAPSASSKFGNFQMNMTYVLTKEWMSMPAGTKMGGGYLKADTNTVIFRNQTMRDAPEALKATFTSSGVSGVFLAESYVMSPMPGFSVQLTNKFVMDETAKVYCQQLLAAKKMDYENFDSDGFPVLSDYSPTGSDGLTTDEVCFSTDIADAKRNVWQYGVYNQNGSRLSLGQAGFPMIAEVTVDGVTETVHGYADYWGVYFDDRFSSAVKYIGDGTPTTFTKENFSGETGTTTYQIRQANARIEKVTKTYSALDSLDKLTAVMWVDKWDTTWNPKWNTLGFTGNSAEYSGSYTKSNNTWTFNKKITWDSGYNEATLSTPIAFTNQEWVDTMKIDHGDGWVEEKNLWLWSPDSGQSYEIGKNSLLNPTSASTTNGLVQTSGETLTPADFPSALYCVERCPTAALLSSSVSAATSASTTGTTVASPFDPDNWQVLKSGENAGQSYPGVLASNVKTYTITGLQVKDATGNEIMFPTSITDPWNDLKSSVYTLPWSDTWTEALDWGVGTGKLVASQSDLDKIECEKNDSGAYRDTHPELNNSAKRYCPGLLNASDSPVTTYYEVRFGAAPWDRTKYLVDQSTGLDIKFASPTVLFYTVPDETRYGDDAGKTLRLDYMGFGQLYGIPGHVVDTQTGESLGKYYSGEWKEHYRYAARFIIEKDALGNDPTISTGGESPTIYKVKALEGEEWLAIKPSAKGTLNYSSDVASDLPAASLLVDVSPTAGNGGIGAEPTSGLINGGKPAVIHEEVVYTTP